MVTILSLLQRREAAAFPNLDVFPSQVGKMVNEQYPLLNHQPALMRAFKATLERGVDHRAACGQMHPSMQMLTRKR